MQEIGSFFPIYLSRDTVRSLPEHVPDKQTYYYSLCREALLEIAKHYKTDNKRVIIPAYTCQTVIDPFVQEGWECRYYDVTRNLRIKSESIITLSESFRPSVCIVHPFLGADFTSEELDTISHIKQSIGCLMVEDITQCIFTTVRHNVFDVVVGSYRKWYSIPDGGFLQLLRNNPSLVIPNETYAENEPFVSLQSDAMYLRGVFLNTGDEDIKEISRRLGNMSMSEINGLISPHKMAGYSVKIMSNSDNDCIQKRRKENYKYLHDNLKYVSTITLVRSSDAEVVSAPLYFPIYVKDRSLFQKMLCQEKIYAPVLWPIKTPEILISPDVEFIFSHILMIPCDQRYGVADMERVVEVIKKTRT